MRWRAAALGGCLEAALVLARAFGVSRPAALVTGVLVVTLPIFAKLQGELPMVGIAGALAALDGAVRFGRFGRARDALEVTAGLIAQALCCEQLARFPLGTR